MVNNYYSEANVPKLSVSHTNFFPLPSWHFIAWEHMFQEMGRESKWIFPLFLNNPGNMLIGEES